QGQPARRWGELRVTDQVGPPAGGEHHPQPQRLQVRVAGLVLPVSLVQPGELLKLDPAGGDGASWLVHGSTPCPPWIGHTQADCSTGKTVICPQDQSGQWSITWPSSRISWATLCSSSRRA